MKGIVARLLLLLLLASPVMAQRIVIITGGTVTANVTDSADFYVTLNQNVTGVTLTSTVTPATGYIVSMKFVQDATGSRTVVFGGNISTSCAVNSTANSVTICRWQYTASSNAWADAAGGAAAQFNVVNYGAKGDAKRTVTATTGNFSPTITDATNSPWLSTDVGKKIFCIGSGGNSSLTGTIATISAFTSASSITVNVNGNASAGAGNSCVWFTQKDTTAFLAAGTAAKAAITTSLFLGYTGAVYCPPGGYVVDGPFFVHNTASGTPEGISFIGAGQDSCIIFMSPDAVVSNNAWILDSESNRNTVFSDFTVACSGATRAITGQGIRIRDTRVTLRHISLDQCGTTGDSNGLIFISGVTGVLAEEIFVNNTNTSTNEPEVVIAGSNNITFRNFYSTNPGPAGIQITGSGGQNSAGGPRINDAAGVLFESSIIDEGGNPISMSITNGSSVNLIGTTVLAGVTAIVQVDGTSSLYLTDTNFTHFGSACAGGHVKALNILSGGYVQAQGSSFQSCGTDDTGLSAAIFGPAGATFVDSGGNDFRNCNGVAPCPTVTIAQFGTRGFAGGIVPKASLTHTPNTCYALAGNLLATAQNICTFLNDQNYQVLNITAQSGGTTPANSACATPPVITLSDGTRTATLTMTTGKTQWSSAVDAATVGSVFASGTTLTISIGANTCATPPVNVAVSYVLQSVLNQ